MLILSLLIFELLSDPVSAIATCVEYNCTSNIPYDLTCYDFNSWSEINQVFYETHINCVNSPDKISFWPNIPIVFNNELDISREFYVSLINHTDTVNFFNSILLCGLSGLNIYPWPALHCNETFCPRKELEISFSAIKFYVNNTPPGDYTCEPGLIPDDSFKTRAYLFFQNI
jgi:hypothetical protein